METQPSTGQVLQSKPSVISYVIVALLFLVLVMQVVTFFDTRARDARNREEFENRAAAIRELANAQNELSLDLMDEYQDVAYGPNVDRIAEQQLIATEYQIISTQVLALQNRTIIELLALPYESFEPEEE